LASEQQAIGQKAGPAREGALGSEPSQIRKIIVFREMA